MRQLAALTAAKTIANTALRWVGPFLPTLERAFGTRIGTLTAVIGLSELGGLSTTLTGRTLDRGHRRRIFVTGLVAVSASSALATVGTIQMFAAAFVVLVIGVANLTVAGHAWIADRVPYADRARSIGAFEISWALALLLGAPVIAVLIGRFGWRGPFVALAAAAAVAAVLVVRLVDADVRPERAALPRSLDRLPASAWAPMVASALICAAGLGVFVVSGAFLDQRHDVPTAGLGLVAMAFGIVELLSSITSAVYADRVGKRTTVLAGLAVMLVGATLVGASGASVVVAIGGLVVFLGGFELAFVTSLSLVSEAAPSARGRALGIGNGLGTIARSTGMLVSGQLFERHGISGPILLSAAVTTVAALLVITGRR